MNVADSVRSQLERTLTRDRPRLEREWKRLSVGEVSAERLAAFQKRLDEAVDRLERRKLGVPAISFPEGLPISGHVEEISRALQTRQVLIVAGETGSGKSTQLPKICLAAGLGIRGLIGHTQPRRLAARTIATRVADELSVSLGSQVGYKIRFTDRTDPQTYIKLMTDGILLAETQNDRFLDQYEVIILDEAHERSLNVDFLLGYLKQRLAQRTDLRLVITSATLDAERFSQHFTDAQGPAPVIEVSGRSYPVDVRYRPLGGEEEGDEEDIDLEQAVVDAIHELSRIDRGDILVFLPTERDILEMAKRLRRESFAGDSGKGTEVLPLYARLTAAEQNRIFEPGDQRRVVLATNVAESSLTVPRVRYVVDTGTARISRYSPRSKILRLPIEPVSRASANQRAGRCGRIAPGVCIRLYGEQDFLRRDEYTTPEIRRTNLAAVILQAKALKLGEIEDYPFLDPPHPESVRDGYKTLFELQALDDHRQLTSIGRQLAQMPVDPRVGRMILAGAAEGCLADVLVIAAGLEIQDPRERPHEKQQQADERHAQFLDKESDFVSLLKLWDFYHHLRETTSRNQLRRACQQNFLSFNRLREWTEIHRQLLEVAERVKLRVGARGSEYAPLHRALLAGLLSGVALRAPEGDYTGAGGLKLVLWPGSGLFRERHAWIVAAERVETTRRYARTVARISPTWIERLAEHLVKRSYSDPRWHAKAGTVMAFEKVSLMGLPVVVQRKVPYGRIDPVVSRRLFIDGALVEQETDANEGVLKVNREVREQIAQMAAQTRRRDWLLDDYSIYAFYDQRLPAEVYDLASLRRWLKADPSHGPSLTMRVEEMIDTGPLEETDPREQFPATLQVEGLELPLRYNFQPGDVDDGVTVTVPVAALQQLSAGQLDWLVPGLLEEKVTALVRSLPKALRRNFVPVPDTAKRLLRNLPFGEGPLLETLAGVLSRWAEERVMVRDFDLSKLPEHLRMNVCVLGPQGEVLRMGRDLDSLRQHLTRSVAELVGEGGESLVRGGLGPATSDRASKGGKTTERPAPDSKAGQGRTERGERSQPPTAKGQANAGKASVGQAGTRQETSGPAPNLTTDKAELQRWQRDNIVAWDFGELPAQITLRQAGIEIPAYPALVDQGTHVQMKLVDTSHHAERLTRRAVARLYALSQKKSLKAQVRWLPRWNEVTLWAASLLKPDRLQDQLHVRISELAFLLKDDVPRSEAQFQQRLANSVERIAVATQEVAAWLPRAFESWHRMRLALEKLKASRYREVAADVEGQVRGLMADEFLVTAPWEWLQHYPRYLDAAAYRVDRVTSHAAPRDAESLVVVRRLSQLYEQQRASRDTWWVDHPQLEEYRWLLEELRVSLFAQQLGTAVKVSPQRLEKLWTQLAARR